MTRKPVKKPRQGAERTKYDMIGTKKRERYMSLLVKGFTAEQIACKLDSSKGRRYRKIKGEVHRVVAEDQEYQSMKAAAAQGAMIESVHPVAEAVIRRGKRGRVDAAKLIFEASGFHNPKVKHEHSGDISISLNMPRPPAVENDIVGEQPALASTDGPIVDAEVVED